MNNAEIIETIKKLLNVTVDKGATEHEQRTAAAHAQRLLLKHNISLAELDAERGGPEMFTQTIYCGGRKRIPAWQKILAGGIGRSFGVGAFSNKRHELAYVQFVGRETNVALAGWMFGTISEEIRKSMTPAIKGQGRTFVASARLAAADRFTERLWHARNAAVTTSGAQALVVSDQAAARAFMERQGAIFNAPKKEPVIKDPYGYMTGYLIGNKLSTATNGIAARPTQAQQTLSKEA